MSSNGYSLGGLAAIYGDALQRGEPTLAFEVAQGKGRFVFLMFFSKEDEESRDRLFLHLRTTKYTLEFKLFGNHVRGGSKVYLTPEKERRIREELQLGLGAQGFEWENFFAELNAGIPQSLPLQSTLDKVRDVWPQVKGELSKVLDDAEKTVLVGIRRLPETHKPRERTLRKLYMYTKGNAQEIGSLIRALKGANITLVWSNEEGANGRSFADIMGDVAGAHAGQK